MCKTRLKPRWITILTGVAICALVCVYSTSDSWAAMCMVGYNSSACSGKSSVPVPPTSTGNENGSSNPEIATDCERLGYAERGAKPNSSLWPKIALKNGANNKEKWVCDPCQTGGTLVRDKSGYARYNCYLKCQSEDEATNILGENGSIDDWKDNQAEKFGTINRPIYYEGVANAVHRVYRDQFVRTQAECNTLFDSKEINGKRVPNKKFYWVTRNVCGQCIEQPCDGAEIIPGCYDVCDNKYTLENGTQCCNKLDKLVSLNPAYGDPDYWYPRTSPLYHESGCYNTTTHATAYGDFNNLPDSDVNTYCYHQVKMTCPDYCDEPKEDNDCTCGPKSCETLASEDWAKAKGLTYSANTGNIVENSVMYHFDNGDVEKINDICYQKTLASDCPSSGCYTLSKLQCPNGEPNEDDCSCGVGCPIVQNPLTGHSQQTIPESEYNRNSNYINGKEYDNGRLYCLKDGCTEDNKNNKEYWSKCYTYNECSDLDSFLDLVLGDYGSGVLIPDGSGGCTCGGKDAEGRTWKTGPDVCDISGSDREKGHAKYTSIDIPGDPNGKKVSDHNNKQINTFDCYTYDGVICQGVLSDGPDDNCECHCTGDYASYYDRGTYKGYSDWTEDDANEPDCTITTNTYTEYQNWINNEGTEMTDIECHRYEYETVECPSRTSRNSSCECECNSGSTAKGSNYSDADKPADTADTVYNYSVDHASYTDMDGDTQYISCYYAGDVTCDDDEVLTEEGCVGCSSGYSTESSAGCDPCGQYFEEKETIDGKNGDKLVCGVCANKESSGKTCSQINSEYTDSIPSSHYQIDDDTWCCNNGSSWYTSISTNEPNGEGTCQTCYQCTNIKDDIRPTLSAFSGKSCKEVVNSGKYGNACTGTKVEIDYCVYGCEKYYRCANIECPDFTKDSCEAATDSTGTHGTPVTPSVSYCAEQGNVFCQFGSGLCRKSTQDFSACSAEEDYE